MEAAFAIGNGGRFFQIQPHRQQTQSQISCIIIIDAFRTSRLQSRSEAIFSMCISMIIILAPNRNKLNELCLHLSEKPLQREVFPFLWGMSSQTKQTLAEKPEARPKINLFCRGSSTNNDNNNNNLTTDHFRSGKLALNHQIVRKRWKVSLLFESLSCGNLF